MELQITLKLMIDTLYFILDKISKTVLSEVMPQQNIQFPIIIQFVQPDWGKYSQILNNLIKERPTKFDYNQIYQITKDQQRMIHEWKLTSLNAFKLSEQIYDRVKQFLTRQSSQIMELKSNLNNQQYKQFSEKIDNFIKLQKIFNILLKNISFQKLAVQLSKLLYFNESDEQQLPQKTKTDKDPYLGSQAMYCTKEGHQNHAITKFCFNRQCRDNMNCCFKCLIEIHQNHQNSWKSIFEAQCLLYNQLEQVIDCKPKIEKTFSAIKKVYDNLRKFIVSQKLKLLELGYQLKGNNLLFHLNNFKIMRCWVIIFVNDLNLNKNEIIPNLLTKIDRLFETLVIIENNNNNESFQQIYQNEENNTITQNVDLNQESLQDYCQRILNDLNDLIDNLSNQESFSQQVLKNQNLFTTIQINQNRAIGVKKMILFLETVINQIDLKMEKTFSIIQKIHLNFINIITILKEKINNMQTTDFNIEQYIHTFNRVYIMQVHLNSDENLMNRILTKLTEVQANIVKLKLKVEQHVQLQQNQKIVESQIFFQNGLFQYQYNEGQILFYQMRLLENQYCPQQVELQNNDEFIQNNQLFMGEQNQGNELNEQQKPSETLKFVDVFHGLEKNQMIHPIDELVLQNQQKFNQKIERDKQTFKEFLQYQDDQFLKLQINDLRDQLFNETLFKDALECKKQHINLDPNKYQQFFNQALTLAKSEHYDEALNKLDQALKLNCNCDEAYYQKGIILQRKKLYDSAGQCVDEAIRINPNSYQFYNTRGDILRSQNQDDKALVYYGKTIKLNHRDYNANYQIGHILHKKNQNEEAIYYLNQAIMTDPQNLDPYYWKQVALRESKRYKEAVKVSDQLINLQPHNHLNFILKGQTLEEMGNFSGAIDCFNKAIQRCDNSYVQEHKKQALLKSGRNEEAQQVQQRIDELKKKKR